MIYICQGSANIPKYVQKSLLKSEHIVVVQPAAPDNNGILTLWFSTERSWLDHLLIKTPVKVKSVRGKFAGASTLNDITWLQTIFVMEILNYIFLKRSTSIVNISLLNATTYLFSVFQAQGWGGGDALKYWPIRGSGSTQKRCLFQALGIWTGSH